MGVRGRARRRRGEGRGALGYSREYLERLARILVHSGHSPRALLREFREVCRALKEPVGRWDPARSAYLADIPHVIAHWHSDPQYLDLRGAPLALPLRGQGPSLAALIERVLPGEDPARVAQSLVHALVVRRRGNRYVPRGRAITYPGPSARVLALNSLLGMLRTVERNVTSPKSSGILERAAFNPSFPVSALPGFHRNLKTQAAEFLWNVDGNMRRRERDDRTGPRTRLGVGIFAFEAPLPRKRARSRFMARGRGTKPRRRR